MALLDDAAIAEIHMYPAWQARIEAAHRAHDVDAFEVFAIAFFEDWQPLDRIFIWPWRAEVVTRAGIPRRRRIRVIVRDPAITNHHVMRQPAAHRFGEAAADRLVRHGERLPRLGVARLYLAHRAFDEVECARGGIGLEITARPVAF